MSVGRERSRFVISWDGSTSGIKALVETEAETFGLREKDSGPNIDCSKASPLFSSTFLHLTGFCFGVKIPHMLLFLDFFVHPHPISAVRDVVQCFSTRGTSTERDNVFQPWLLVYKDGYLRVLGLLDL